MKKVIGHQVTGDQHKEDLTIIFQASVSSEGFGNDLQPDQEAVIGKPKIIGSDKGQDDDPGIH